MSWYVQEILIREQLADAQRRAAHNQLVREARAHRAPSHFWRRLVGWFRAGATRGAVLVPQTKGR